MKKKSFFSGIGAKLVLAAVALSSTLMTGCYKDEGLDVVTPGSKHELPAPKYTITGVVYNSNGVILEEAKVNGTATNKGSYTLEVAAGNVELTATCAGYDEQKTTVKVAELQAGQSAVYPVNFVLTAVKNEVDVVYNLTVNVWDEDMAAIEGADVKVYATGGTLVSDLTKLNAGTYMIKVSKDGYNTTVQYLTLAAKKVDAAAAVESVVSDVVLSAKEAGKIVIAGNLKFGEKWMLAKVITLSNDKGDNLGQASNVYAYRFEVSEDEFVEETEVLTKAAANKVFKANFSIIDENGIELKITQNFALPTESTPGEPGEETNTEIKIDFSFYVIAGWSENEGDVLTSEEEFDPAITNATDGVKTYKYTPMIKEGLKVSETGLELINKNTPLGLAVVEALDVWTEYAEAKFEGMTVLEEGDDWNVIPSPWEFDLSVPAMSAMSSVTLNQYLFTAAIEIREIYSVASVDGVETETEVDSEDLKKVKINYEGISHTEVAPNVTSIEHGHGHSHGHGTGNAGGGIVEAE